MMDTFLRWLPLGVFILQGLMAWGMWSLAQKFVTRGDCKDCKSKGEAEGEKSEDRITSLEASVNSLPTRAELTALGDKIGPLTEKIGHLNGRLAGVGRAVDLLNQHHLGKGQ